MEDVTALTTERGENIVPVTNVTGFYAAFLNMGNTVVAKIVMKIVPENAEIS